MSDVDENEVHNQVISLVAYNIKANQLSDELTMKVMAIVTEACEKSTLQKDLAEHIKKAVDQVPELNTVPGKGPWQCIVGKSFATATTHETNFSVFFDLPEQGHTVFLFKSLSVQDD